jgi:hypothetical protein
MRVKYQLKARRSGFGGSLSLIAGSFSADSAT